MNIIVNQTLTVGDIMLLIVAWCSLGLSIFAIWRTKRLQLHISKPKFQANTELPKEKTGTFIATALGFFLLIVGVCMGVILGNSSLYPVALVGVGMVILAYGIVRLCERGVKDTKDEKAKKTKRDSKA